MTRIPKRKNRNPKLGLLLAAGGVALLGTACEFEIETSDRTVTESFDVEDFNEVEIAQAFETKIIIGDETGVEFRVDDELVDILKVEVENDRLTIGFGEAVVSTSGPMEVTITTPELSALTTGGAADVNIDAVNATDFDLEVSGSANVQISGTITNLDLEVSGASNVDLSGTSIDSAEIDIAGASNVELTDVDEVTGRVIGASNVDVPDSGTFDIETEGVGVVN